jgi:hypothetical protein
MRQLIATTTTATLFCIVSLQNSLCNANELHDFNQLLVAPISAVFGAHNAPKDTVYFYKSLFEKGWPLLLCLDSDNECTYLQVHPFNTRIILSIYLIQPFHFRIMLQSLRVHFLLGWFSFCLFLFLQLSNAAPRLRTKPL